MQSASPDVGCPACGGELLSWRSVPPSERGLAGQTFELRRCRDCGSAITVGDAPAELHESGAYRPGNPRLYGAALPILNAFDRQRLALLEHLLAPPARLLDVGAGRGRFVAAARAAGYDAFGIEPSHRGSQAAQAIEAPVERASIAEADIAAGSLDAVTLWHVLEHLDDPGGGLARVATWMRPGGALLVGVPNLASLQARVGGDRWYHLDVPRHRVHFTAKGLGKLLNAHGFTVLRIDHRLLEHNSFGMWQSIVNRLTHEPSYLYNLLKRNAPVRPRDLAVTGMALPLAPAAALAELLAGLARRGGTIAVLARRTSQVGRGRASRQS